MNRWTALALPLLLLLSGPPQTTWAQDDDPWISVGAAYTYVVASQRSGIGGTALKPISDRFGIELRSDYFFVKQREQTGGFTRSEFDQRLWTVSMLLHVTAARFGSTKLYGTLGLQNRLRIEEGTYFIFNDTPPYRTTTRSFERTRTGIAARVGGGLSIEYGVSFFVEPNVTFVDASQLSFSGGVRIPL